MALSWIRLDRHTHLGLFRLKLPFPETPLKLPCMLLAISGDVFENSDYDRGRATMNG